MSKITIYTARRIHTMSASNPIAEAVAVRDGIILEAGRLEDMQPWLQGAEVTIDDQFADKVLFPGFIDPHLHPSLGATILPCNFITAFEWDLGSRKVPATRGREEYLTALAKAVEGRDAAQKLFVSYGYHRTWHGLVGRADLNAIAPDFPVIIWHRSFHELIMNDAAIDLMGLDREMLANHPQVDADHGVFFETGAALAMNGLRPHLFSPGWFGKGLEHLKQILHAGGHTTVGDMAWGIFDFEVEWQSYSYAIEEARAPLRVMMIPRGIPEAELTGDPAEAVAQIVTLCDRGSHRLFFDKHVKLFTDGAFFSELMQVQEPGFIDGHHGEWLTAPEQFEAAARAYWNEGYRIHVHCTGDLGVELALDVLEKLQFERPRFDHRFTIEHFGVSTEEQVRRIKALGALVSANVYYVHELGEAYWRHSIGHERASQMARLGSLAREGVPFALHSDFTLAPARPLNSVWVAVNRIAESGAVLGENERISVDQAMRAITIDAAYVLGQEARIGSIRAGKSADFTVLDDDPYEVAPASLRDIRIHATVFEGAPHLIED
jgi:predicted amidohydrolase YtcJ